MYIHFRLKYPLFLSNINETFFSNRFSKNIQVSNFMKILKFVAKLCYADGRTDGRTVRQTDRQLIVVLRDFAKEPKNCLWCSHYAYVFCTDLRTYSDFSLYGIKKLVLCNRGVVFTARYALSPYIKQTHFLFKWLMLQSDCKTR